MTTRPWALRTGSAAAVVLAAVGLLGAQKPDAAPDRPQFIKDNVLDNACLRCHMEPRESDKEKAAKFVLLRESAYWGQHDLHRRAFDALGSELGRQMSRRLYGDEAAAAQKPACLVCHATDSQPGTPLARKTADQFYCNYGVNCQACHGPAQEWAFKHIDDQVWREKHPKEKTALGQVDLRDPHVRAAKCVSCHVGNAAGGKFVTHEMYASGHPPLPPFELATFSRDEPRHWRPAAAVKHIADLPADKARALFHYRKGEPESARLVAVGAVVALRESAALTGFEPDPDRPAAMLDFAHFNCAACHHDLRVPSPRQANGFPGVPGRPVPQTWPVWIVRAVLTHAAAKNQSDGARLQTEFDAAYANYRKAFDAAPFGDPAEVRKAADGLVRTCDDLLKFLDGFDYTEQTAAGLLIALVRQGEEATLAGDRPGRRDFPDADGAAQLARAAASIYLDLADSLPPPDAGKPDPSAPSFAALKPDPKNLGESLAALHDRVGLTVRESYVNGIGPDGKPLPDANRFLIQSNDILGQRLKRAAAYDPGAVRRQFAELARRLEAGPGRRP